MSSERERRSCPRCQTPLQTQDKACKYCGLKLRCTNPDCVEKPWFRDPIRDRFCPECAAPANQTPWAPDEISGVEEAVASAREPPMSSEEPRNGTEESKGVLEDLVNAEEGRVWRARLELSLVHPDRAQELTARASKLLDEDVAAAHGRWVLEEWRPRIEEQELSPGARFEAALLAGRTALFRGNDEKALELFDEAARAAPERALLAAPRVLETDALPARLRVEDEQSHWLKARAYKAFGVSDGAIKEADAALAAATPGEDLHHEVAVLDLKARLLEESERPEEAAAALVDLGRRHDMRHEHGRAVEAYLRATELDPRNAEARWYLGDSRRLAAALAGPGPAHDAEIRQAREDLHAGLAIRASSAAPAWVYWTGALLAEEMATKSDDAHQLLFEAALFAEQAVALDPSVAGPYSLLVRYHRMLRNPAASMVTLDQAVQTDPADKDVLREGVLMRAELGLKDALEALDKYEQRLQLAEPAVRGFVLLYQGRYELAEQALRTAVDERPDNVRRLRLRALARALADDLEGAREDGQRVLDLTAPDGTRTDPMSRAWAALLTRNLDEARALFHRELEAAWADPGEARLGLACAEQLADDSARALALLAEAAELARYPRHAAAGRLTLELAERLDAPVAWRADLQLFDEAAKRLAGRSYNGAEALDELAAVEQASVEGDTRWLMAVAARARVLAMLSRWSDAADAYEALLGKSIQSPPSQLVAFTPARSHLVSMLSKETEEAMTTGDVQQVERAHRRLFELGEVSERLLPLTVVKAHRTAGRLEDAFRELEPLRRAEGGDPAELADAWRISGDVLLELQRPEEAMPAYERALDAMDATALEDRAAVQARLGVAAAAAGDTAKALGHMRAALEVIRLQEGRTKAAETVVAACTDVGSFAGTPPLLPMTVRALLEDREVSRGQRRRLASAWFEVLRHDEEVVDGAAVGVISPVVLEADEELLSAGAETDGASSKLIDEAIPAMRRRVLEGTGVLIPGVRIRASEACRGRRRFQVHLHGVPYVGGCVPKGATLCTDGPACRERSLIGKPLPNAWPGGEAGIWLEADDAHKAEMAGLPLLGACDAMLWRLEGLLRLHLHRLLGLAEVDYMVQEWRTEAAADRSELVAAALPDQHARIRFTAVVRALVREQVSVADLGRLLEAFGAAGTGPESVHQTVEAVSPAELTDIKNLESDSRPEAAHAS